MYKQTVIAHYKFHGKSHAHRMKSIVGRNVLGSCQRCNTNMDNVITCSLDITKLRNNNRVFNTVSETQMTFAYSLAMSIDYIDSL